MFEESELDTHFVPLLNEEETRLGAHMNGLLICAHRVSLLHNSEVRIRAKHILYFSLLWNKKRTNHDFQHPHLHLVTSDLEATLHQLCLQEINCEAVSFFTN